MGSKKAQGGVPNNGPLPAPLPAAASLGSGPKWDEPELKTYYRSFHKLGTNWSKVARAVGHDRTAEECESLYRQHQTFLSLPSQPQLETAFVAMVTDVYNNLKDGDSDTVSDDEVGARERNDSTGTSTPQAANKGRRTPRAARRGNNGASAGEAPVGRHAAASGVHAAGSNTLGKGGATPGSKAVPHSPTTPASALRSMKSPQHSLGGLDTPSSKRKRSRKLFSEEDEEAQGEAMQAGQAQAGAQAGGMAAGGEGQGAGRPYRWSRQGGQHDDVGEGVDALLSLASGAQHATSSMTEGQNMEGNGDDDATGTVGFAHGGVLMPSPAKGAGLLSPLGKGRLQPSPPPAYGSPLKTMSVLEAPRSAILQRRDSALRPSGGSRAAEHALQELAGEPSTPTMLAGTTSLGTYSPLNLQPLMAMPPPLDLDAQLNYGPQPTILDAVHPETPTYPPRLYPPALPSRLSSMPAVRHHHPHAGTLGRAHKRKPGPEKLPPMMSPIKLMFQRAGLLGPQAQQGTYGQSLPGARHSRIGETGEPMGVPELLLRHCLGPRTRRWCMYEFHYSAIDYPWFLRNELQEFLTHLGLTQATHLTRTEWSIIRSAFGRPRRLSLAFLKEERTKLEGYRETVRKKYEEVGVGMEVPQDLPRALRVGQEVTARHPVTRQLHDGVILTVKGAKYRVQFNRSELMTEVVKDVDIMPLDPSDNLPISMAGLPLLLNGRINAGPGGPSRKRPPPAPARGPAAGRAQQEARAAAQAAVEEQSREVDGMLLMDVSSVLDMKEELLARLRDMNSQAEAGMHLDSQGRQSEDFQRRYAAVVLQLKDVNQQAEVAMSRLAARVQLIGLAGLGGPIPLATSPPPSQTALQGPPEPRPGSAGPPQAASMMPTGLQPPLQMAVFKEEDAGGDGGAPGAAYLDEPSAIVGSAMAEARMCVLKTWQESRRNRAAAAAAAPGASSGEGEATDSSSGHPPTARPQQSAQEEAWLTDTVTGCVGMLFTVQRCITNNVGPQAVEVALDTALRSLRPHCARNATYHRAIADAVASLRAQLTRST